MKKKKKENSYFELFEKNKLGDVHFYLTIKRDEEDLNLYFVG